MCMCDVYCGKTVKQASLCFLFHISKIIVFASLPKRLYCDYSPGKPG